MKMPFLEEEFRTNITNIFKIYSSRNKKTKEEFKDELEKEISDFSTKCFSELNKRKEEEYKKIEETCSKDQINYKKLLFDYSFTETIKIHIEKRIRYCKNEKYIKWLLLVE